MTGSYESGDLFDASGTRRSISAVNEVATWMEGTAAGKVGQGRHAATNLVELVAGCGHLGQGVEQSLGVGMLGVIDDLSRRPLLDDASGVHDQHTLRYLADHTQVMGDENQGDIVAFTQRQ